VAALTAAGAAHLDGKVLLDVSNPLDFSEGFPPKVPTVEGGISVAEAIQRAFPGAKVVKSLNTVGHEVMVQPSRVPGPHQVFVNGEDQEAKAAVTALLGEFGWAPEQVVDLGGLAAARPLEQYVALWLALSEAVGTRDVNISVHWPR
jgi:predicted dinucleotide-binding enzyme